MSIIAFAFSGQVSSGGAAPEQADGVCANIGPSERRKRLMGGILSFALALAVLAALLFFGVDRWWRILLFLPFAGATFGFFQWRDQTCVAFAARSIRRLGDDPAETVSDANELSRIGRQARGVEVKALLAAIVLTLIALALP